MIGDLASPRGIALGPAGEIYVADIGAASQPGSGRVLPIMADGTTAPILVSAANFTAAPHGETYIYGLSDVAVQADSLLLSDVAVQADSLLFSVGFGATGNGALGVPNRLLRLGPTGALSPVFDFDRVEQERDPDGRGAGSNATGIGPAPDGAVWISDAGGNWVARLTGDGSLLGLVVFPAVDGEEAVPTGLAIGPDGQAYVTLFRCPVPTGGKGGVARVAADGAYEIVASGLSNPIDVAFGPDGMLHVLEFAVDYAPASGRLVRVAGDGRAEVLANGLSYPTSLAIDGAGRLYVTEMAGVAGGPPGSGRLVRFEPGG